MNAQEARRLSLKNKKQNLLKDALNSITKQVEAGETSAYIGFIYEDNELTQTLRQLGYVVTLGKIYIPTGQSIPAKYEEYKPSAFVSSNQHSKVEKVDCLVEW